MSAMLSSTDHAAQSRPADTLTTLAGTLLGVGMMLLLHRYQGIYHDSILYMGQGLMQRWPDIYGQDLFFRYGSQADYTILPWLLGHAFGLATPPAVFLWGTLASMLMFAVASRFAIAAILPKRQRHWAWLGTLCLPAIYGMVHIFSYNEYFLTSRPLAETFSLFGLGLLMRQRWRLAAACLAIATAFHPLQAIGAILIAWIWAVMQDRRWLHALWGVLPLLGLALAGAEPFTGLLQQADSTWFTEMKYSRHVFVTLWNINDFKTLGFDVVILASAWRILGGQFGTWCLAALAGLVLGISASLILADGLHLVLPVGLQLWRVHWLAHWFSMAAIAALLFHHAHTKQWVCMLLLSLAALLAWGETAWGWLLIVAMYLVWPLVPEASRARLQRLLTVIFSLAIILLLANHVSNELHWFKAARYQLDLYQVDRRLLAFPALAFGIPLFATLAWERLQRPWRGLAFLLLLCPLAILSGCLWDARSDMQRVFEDTPYRADVFGPTIPRSAQVYWEPAMLVGTWLTLQRANYYSDSQLSGQMFKRGTFKEGLIRQTRMLPLSQEAARCVTVSKQTGLATSRSCLIRDSSLLKACAPGKDGGPDYIILPYAQRYPSAGTWMVRSPRTHKTLATFRLYSCPSLMNNILQAKA